MKQRTLLSLLLFALVLVGCDSGDPVDEPPPQVLLPLEVGNAWVMAFTRTHRPGTPDETSESHTDTLRVVRDTTVAGERWAEIRCSDAITPCFPGGFYSNREDGVWKWRDPRSPDTEPHLLYRYPAAPGDTYEQPSSIADISMTVLSTDARVETPSGSLSAYHYQLDADTYHGIENPIPDEVGRVSRYLVPGQGFASIDCSYLAFLGEWKTASAFRWELISFEGE